MNRKKGFWLIGGICIVAAIVLLVVKVAIPASKRVKREPTPTIPAQIPQGSVVVWRRTATIFSKNGSAEYYLEKYQYDEYGRCVQNVHYVPDDGTTTTLYEYDEALHRTMASTVKREDQTTTEKRTHIYNAKGDQVGFVFWRYNGEQLLKDSETVSEPDAWGDSVFVADIGYAYDGSITSLEWRVYDEKTRKASWRRYLNYNKLRESDGNWKTLAEAAEDGDFEVVRVTEYDEKGRVCREYEVKDDGTYFLTLEVKYREDGTGTWMSYDENGLNAEREMDAEGRPLKTKMTDADGNVVRTSEYTYEDLPSGGRREIIDVNNFGSGSYRGEWEYNANGDLVKKTYWSSEVGETVDVINTYDDQGRLVKRERPAYKEVWKFEYDEYGNLVKQTGTSEEWGTQTEEYINSPFVLDAEKAKEGEAYFCPLYFTP